MEVCCRWSLETKSFLNSLPKARSEPLMRKRRAGLASLGIPVFLHSSTLRRMSLLELPGARGAGGHCPLSHDVERDFRHAGLDTQFFCSSLCDARDL